LFILAVVWLVCKPVVLANVWLIALMLLAEAVCILVCLMRFGKFPARHSFLAKFYGVCLLAGLIALLVFNAGNWAIISPAIVAVIANTEIIVIHLIAAALPVDVACIFVLLKKTKPPKKFERLLIFPTVMPSRVSSIWRQFFCV
jgi:hypothetical protein